jgi:hypothetical protein
MPTTNKLESSQTAQGLTTASQEAAETLEGGFLELLFMLLDYIAMCGRSTHKECKTDIAPKVVSSESLQGAHHRG